MSGNRPTSYDDIVRRTVPEPGSGFRSSSEEEQLSRHRAGKAADHIPHAATVEEQDTLAVVEATLKADSTLDLSNVRMMMDGRELVLKGNVPGPSTSARIADIAGKIAGVDRIDNQLAIRGIDVDEVDQ